MITIIGLIATLLIAGGMLIANRENAWTYPPNHPKDQMMQSIIGNLMVPI